MKRAKRVQVSVECISCDATGITRGVNMKAGEGVICEYCNGKGETKMSYIPFTQRVKSKDIKKVYLMRGSLGSSMIPEGEKISYQEFLKTI